MKLVMIINQELPLGLIANTTAVLGLSLGERVPDLIGPDIQDEEGIIHAGITKVNIPVLGTSREQLKDLYENLAREKFDEITMIDFNTVAQRSKCYEDYTIALAATSKDELDFLGVCLYGPEEKINKLTGNLRLLR
ncbi:MAG TPA: DUF2000 domain-containing protein [Firmicutes bacterium]|jgi:hypothetical protein|nr:DUF2000 domain-containing protein [Bacillota bacterium]